MKSPNKFFKKQKNVARFLSRLAKKAINLDKMPLKHQKRLIKIKMRFDIHPWDLIMLEVISRKIEKESQEKYKGNVVSFNNYRRKK